MLGLGAGGGSLRQGRVGVGWLCSRSRSARDRAPPPRPAREVQGGALEQLLGHVLCTPSSPIPGGEPAFRARASGAEGRRQWKITPFSQVREPPGESGDGALALRRETDLSRGCWRQAEGLPSEGNPTSQHRGSCAPPSRSLLRALSGHSFWETVRRIEPEVKELSIWNSGPLPVSKDQAIP